MNKQNKNNSQEKNGFTIIEVVLVLAIAGLIFLMVFIAFPALQRGQRDTQRKNDLSRIETQLTNYGSSTRNKVPTDPATLGAFTKSFLKGDTLSVSGSVVGGTAGDEYSDPSTGPYILKYDRTATIASIIQGTVYYASGSICDDDNPGQIKTSGSGVGARNYSLRIQLESQDALYCVDNR